ncbi:hypothetical protein, partial [Hungatella effluvii]|uniref:hypothetical protein n=1 Tax=Hungatella effluvii TaxID=1096246 RepID=UPI002A82C549
FILSKFHFSIYYFPSWQPRSLATPLSACYNYGIQFLNNIIESTHTDKLKGAFIHHRQSCLTDGTGQKGGIHVSH